MTDQPHAPVSAETVEAMHVELIRRASEGCEGPLDEPCYRRPEMPRLWCDPCRCQEAAKALASERERAEQDVALAKAVAGSGAEHRAEEEMAALRRRAEQAEREREDKQAQIEGQSRIIDDLREVERDYESKWPTLQAERETLAREVEALREAQAWRPIETHDGEKHRNVLVWQADTRCTYTASWDGAYWIHFGGSGGIIHSPTHWQPLPSPPPAREKGEA